MAATFTVTLAVAVSVIYPSTAMTTYTVPSNLADPEAAALQLIATIITTPFIATRIRGVPAGLLAP
jgi:hypothetical protein